MVGLIPVHIHWTLAFARILSKRMRRRIQGGHTDTLSSLQAHYQNVSESKLTQLVSASFALLAPESAALGLPDFPTDNLDKAAHLLAAFPWISVQDCLSRLYPHHYLLPKEGRGAVENILASFQIRPEETALATVSLAPGEGRTVASLKCGFSETSVEVACGLVPSPQRTPLTVETESLRRGLVGLLQNHLAGDICVVGPRGCGKSTLVSLLAHSLGYTVEPIVLYQDMTSRDLIQQRATLATGDTVWRDAPLVCAALEGKLAVLDGLHRLHPSTLAVLQRSVHVWRDAPLVCAALEGKLAVLDGLHRLHPSTLAVLQSVCYWGKLAVLDGLHRLHPSTLAVLQRQTVTVVTSTSPHTQCGVTPLVCAALEGKLAVLDGLHRLHPSTLAVLQRSVNGLQ
ncbi:von Willebrand factor A domain-containing protein 8 [Homalodisca vitripennis]|nr:von Willebrand factor A domain-containing protein 8 [Homalodisca vitripennis]